MSPCVINTATWNVLERVAAFGERRHEVLAGNVANIDTPNYRMRDLPIAAFEQALNDALEKLQEGQTSRHTISFAGMRSSAQTPNFDELFPASLFRAAEPPATNITFHDGSNRSIEHQMMEMTKNAMMQNFALNVMLTQINLLQAAISERP
jgi:flagellar basal-body rod protein FlgB